MGSFSQLVKKRRPPARALLLEPWVFADEWDRKPSEPVCVGLRLMSESDKGKARAEAERIALEYHPNGGENLGDAYVSALIRQVAALAICDPNDVTKPSEILPLAEEQVRFALTSRGAEHIFEAYRRYEVETSAIETLADKDDVTELVATLGKLDVEALQPSDRRLISYLLDRLSG